MKSITCSVMALVSCLSLCLTAKARSDGNIQPLSAETQKAMIGRSWTAGCPVPLTDLVAVSVKYVGFDRATHDGTIVIHKRFAADVEGIFRDLFAIKFPIRNVSTYENYDVGKSAYADATVGFYCRRAQDAPNQWSGHAYGAAIDINPLENPFLDPKDGWWPETAASDAVRDDGEGKISSRTKVFNIFARHGWAWGGFYDDAPDYMHFYKLTVGTGSPLERHYVVKEMDFLPEETVQKPPQH